MKLSIITITFNDIAGLKDTYRSIIQQTFRDFEWIVVDGGSTDGTREFLKEHDSEIAFWCSEPDKGVYNAQNKGTEHARGEYSIYMNSGDSFYDGDVLEKVFKEGTDADIVYGNTLLVFEDGKTMTKYAPDEPDMSFFYNENLFHQAMFIKTKLILDLPYDESFQIFADWNEWLTLYLQGKSFEKKDMVVCKFLFGGLSTSTSNDLDAKRKEELSILREKFYPEPWRKAMSRVGFLSTDYCYLKAKRKQHNRIIRILIVVCCLLLVTNILTVIYICVK